MIFKKIRLFNHSKTRLITKKLDAEHLPSEIDALVRCIQARINLFHGFSELNTQLGIGGKFQQHNMLDK